MNLEFEGVTLKVEQVSKENPLQPGENYVAKRNGPWQILTCKEHKIDDGWVVPVEGAYCFDTWECYRILGGL